MESISKSFGRIIRERRKKLRLSQRQIAGLSGKTQSQIARLEAGVDDPRFSSVVQVSRSLGAEIVLVPIRLLPAVRHLLDQHEPGGGSKPAAKLVGNEPEDADEEGRDES
jgi:transcriptional regulator with XRE-family HTH domain